MKVISTDIDEVKIIEPTVFGDERGFFMETWNERDFAAEGIAVDFVQDNHSRSVKHTLRGLHYQVEQPQGKLVRVTRGEVFDVAVDMRRDSPTFGHWVGETLSDTNARMLWVPEGFAHGFLVLSDSADFQYKCTNFYAPQHERSLLWCDKSLDIDWPLPNGVQPTLSSKDASGKEFHLAECY